MAYPSRKRWWDAFQSSDERVYIVPSIIGILVGLSLVLVFSIGVYHVRPLIQLLAFLMGLFFLVGMIQSNQNLSGISMGIFRVRPTETREIGHFFLRILNQSEEPKFALQGKLMDLNTPSQELPVLPKNSDTEISFQVQAPARGVYPYPTIQVYSVFPIGFFRAWRQKKFEGEWLVYPKPSGNALLPSQMNLGGNDFKGHRKHVSGESEKKIDWKAHARGAKRLVKEFEEEDLGEEHFYWDQLEGLDLESRLSQLALWVLKANEVGKPFSMTLPETFLSLGSGEKHAHQALKLLAVYPS
jgi:uncharacterized protein (DUF58 family)